MERENKEFEFVDFTKDTGKKEKSEQLVLFLERAYVKGISEKLEQEMFRILLRMVKRKSGKLSISLLISHDYIWERVRVKSSKKRVDTFIFRLQRKRAVFGLTRWKSWNCFGRKIPTSIGLPSNIPGKVCL